MYLLLVRVRFHEAFFANGKLWSSMMGFKPRVFMKDLRLLRLETSFLYMGLTEETVKIRNWFVLLIIYLFIYPFFGCGT